MLEITGLTVGYYRDLHILRDVSLTAPSGRITALLGANGTGKSTLLKTVFGQLTPAAGAIRFADDSLVRVPPHQMARRGVAYLPQHTGLFLNMSVEENIMLGAWTLRGRRDQVRTRLRAAYERFPDLHDKRRQPAGELSGGQQRMAEIAKALMIDPRLLLIDEPTAGLARSISRDIYRLLAGLRDEGRTILLADQKIRQALQVADHVCVLELGRIRAEGPAAQFTNLEREFWVQ